ncbi:MAG: nitric oxide synthase oxygenase [Bacteroidetes bacterium]|nr:nitric oxide synthase oxygenase [Bacteroidota bacterium]MDA1269117.1 nitric oxide synthase oxygenase [Bacteroidota bacterium]
MPTSFLFKQAQEFIQQYFLEFNLTGLERRLDEVKSEILHTGTYRLTEEELGFGAKLAWRNSNRCMGRLFWKSLKVRDLRTLTTSAEVFADALEHLESATQGGKIRSTLSVYATEHEGDRGFRILNKQLVRFAGYTLPNGKILGDPDSLAFTRYCMSLGWEGKKTAFDLLPLVIQRQGEPASWFAIPEEKVFRVALSHPEYPWFKDLGLQWYAVPVISDMRLEIGGISFPCAPFNGWYMLTEIAARNLGDVQRYNLLPVLAKKLNLNTRQVKTLWKDKALLVLQEAVLYSFQLQGVTLVDHHTAAEQFLEFCKQEESKGRVVQADWTWIVPPAASSTLGVFHQEWDNQILSPNFHYQSAPWNGEEEAKVSTFSAGKCPFSDN